MLRSHHRLAILLHDGLQGTSGKTGLSLLRYSPLPIVAVIDASAPGESVPALTGIQREVPIVASVQESLSFKPDVLAIGIAPSGGALPDAWSQEIRDAIAAGLSIVNGLHAPMASDPALGPLPKSEQWIWDVRQEPKGLNIGSGQARSLPCRRVLAIGTDMAVGKMSTCLELHEASQELGYRSQFIATGQTGLMLGYGGVPLDAVRIDFAAGAVEQQVMRYGRDHDVVYIEGQGSLLHPGSTATLPLLRGSQPTHLVLVHRMGQTAIKHWPEFRIPPLNDVIQMYESVSIAAGTFRNDQGGPKVVAIALNTHHLDDSTAQAAIEQIHDETGLPCTDVIRFGAAPIIDAIFTEQ
ncbi:MAG: DUF1611 domain-containing protein [Merismopedia sp. SIO2A8]|nr:DUF1611 domain-containing protein [Merismopedia sp. SIO2A8]